MTDTQGYKTGHEFTFLTELEKANIVSALFDREEWLLGEIRENEEIGWKESAAIQRADLATVRDLMKRLGVSS